MSLVYRGSRKSACAVRFLHRHQGPSRITRTSAVTARVRDASPCQKLCTATTKPPGMNARGRRFTTARRVAEMVRQAIVLIGGGPSDGGGRRDEIRQKVMEGHGLLRSYLAAAKP